MKISRLIVLICIAINLISCKTNKNASKIIYRELPEITIKPGPLPNLQYKGSNTILCDLKNTKLEVSFDWKKQYLFGKETLTLEPHFYDQNILWLNARGMEILEVKLLSNLASIPVVFEYKNDSLKIVLDKYYKKQEEFKVYINYISKPEELKSIGGSDAITSNKGLYFINPLEDDPNKPMQIWTQGETQSNSVWFPTIDSPNQKMTQEINITIDSSYTTLSNGLLIKSIDNHNGTRTDLWKQTIPHAPYLAMMVIGKFAVIKDQWRGKEVNYYVEPEYKNVAKSIFGNTPQMLDFFSDKLKVVFPWDKYNQVVVRDYVSGAMENSSASLFGEFMQRDARQLLDQNYEEYIAHELFHQWFGDLVTCESWANTTLNEGFATYGEYLWNEHKYGRDFADIYLQKDLNDYLREAKGKQVDLIRFQYDNNEDLFDRHSYDKGGCIIHMLRKYVGDDAFFASLHNYLENNKFKTVEAHQLRLAFEEVTGEDLNWFFNQWFFNKGNPKLDITYGWDEIKKEASISIIQQQDLKISPLYKLPVDIDIYEDGNKRHERIIIDLEKQTFNFKCNSKPSLINFDAEKMLIATKTDHHTEEEWIELFNDGKLYLDRFEALQHFGKEIKAGSPQAAIITKALVDPNWKIRNIAIRNSKAILQSKDSLILKEKLKLICKNDVNTMNRSLAMQTLSSNFSGIDLNELYKLKLNDSSYDVSETAVQLLMEHDSINGLLYVNALEKDSTPSIMDIVTNVYSQYGGDQNLNYMNYAFSINKNPDGRYSRIQNFGKFLQRCTSQQGIEKGLMLLRNEGINAQPWYMRFGAFQVLVELKSYFNDKEKETDSSKNINIVAKYLSLQNTIENYLKDLKSTETNSRLKKIYDKK